MQPSKASAVAKYVKGIKPILGKLRRVESLHLTFNFRMRKARWPEKFVPNRVNDYRNRIRRRVAGRLVIRFGGRLWNAPAGASHGDSGPQKILPLVTGPFDADYGWS